VIAREDQQVFARLRRHHIDRESAPVGPLRAGESAPHGRFVTTLADLKPGQRGRVIDVECGTAVGQRILQLGLLEGTEVEVIRRAPAGDPLEVRLMGYSLSLRADEARSVVVEVRE
jgi:Fe2+ transport system protein FeoA